MKKFKFNKISIIVFVALFIFGLGGIIVVRAVTPPDLTLGITSDYSVYGHAGITNTDGGTSTTRVWGNVGDNNVPGDDLTAVQVPDGMIDHSTDNGTLIENDARSVYDSLMSDLERPASQDLNLAGTHTVDGGNPITPGVYNVGATTLNGAVELSGAGVYIFRSSSSLTIATIGGSMTLRNGATPCNVWWAIPASMTIGSDSIMVGNIIASTGLISLGTRATLEGRAISLTKAVTLDANQITEPTCAVPSTLVLNKIVDNTGSAIIKTSDDFQAKIDGVDVPWVTPQPLTTGVQYTASEVGLSNYTASVWGGGCAADGTITLVPGVNTCTITNTYTPATLKVIKHVVNDNGGLLNANNWVLTVSSDGGSGTGYADGTESPGTSYTLEPGHQYSVAESGGSSGYSQSSISDDCTITSAVSGTPYICTITNDDIAPHLIVIKHVINDNGGSALASSFLTTITSVTTATPTADGRESLGVDNILTSVGAYSIDEGAHIGYDKTLSTDCSGTIALGQTKTCTITNNDIDPGSSSGGTVYGCKDPNATNYNFFSSSKPELCIYEPTITILSTPVVATTSPSLPKTGFAPQVKNIPWYILIFHNIINFFI